MSGDYARSRERFNDQFRETSWEREERFRKSRDKQRAEQIQLQDMLEVVAQAIAAKVHVDGRDGWRDYETEARAAIEAMLKMKGIFPSVPPLQHLEG